MLEHSLRRYSSRALLGNIKRLQLALQPFVQRPLLHAMVSSLQLVALRFSLCSVDPRAPQGAAEAQSR